MNRVACFLMSAVFCVGWLYGAEKAESRWEKDISAFEAWDAKNSFPSDGVLFVGSSSIRMWPTRECFPELDVINRGFGGSHVSDVVEFADRIVLPYKPRLIVFYAGDNDIAAGKSPEQVLKDYREFVKIVHGKLSRVPIVYMSIKPSGSRWSLWPKMAKANQLISDFSVGDTRLFYVDGATVFLGDDGKPEEKFYISDKLHLSVEGYKVWTELLSPIATINDMDLAGKSLALYLISKGMGPHKVSADRLSGVTFGKKSQTGASRKRSADGEGGDVTSWVASKNSKVFHKSTCQFVGRIAEKNRVVFASRQSAAGTGRRPCKTCNP